jgi:hypothetical protein
MDKSFYQTEMLFIGLLLYFAIKNVISISKLLKKTNKINYES